MRADPVVSQRLQQASEQLQAAIRSARKRRHSKGDVSEKTWQLEPTVMLSPEHEKNEEGRNNEDDAVDWEQRQSLEDVASTSTSLASLSQTTTKGCMELRAVELICSESDTNKAVESDMRKALEWIQRDVERQARENRSVRETLARAIHDITDIIAYFVAPEVASMLAHMAAKATGMSPERDSNAARLQLAPDKVDELVNQWDDALVSWREQSIVEKRELVEGFAHFEEECLARMKAGEASHRLEQERLRFESNQHQMICEDYSSRLTQQLEDAYSTIESLQTNITELSSTLVALWSENDHPVCCDAAMMATMAGDNDKNSVNGNLQRQVLGVVARANPAELYALQCEATLTKQIQRTTEIENRLSMLLEACETQQHRPPASAVPTETVEIYRQKLELLEDRMQDVLHQVACDHEQFEYEQAKWALEKRYHREKYDEVLDACVKVLKVLIIREKLMKKNERTQTRATQECQEKELEIACQTTTLHGITTELMQQSAMVLLVLQQLTVLKSNTNHHSISGSWIVPAKPIQMKSMIRRLKKIEASLCRREWISLSRATEVHATKVCPFPSTERLSG